MYWFLLIGGIALFFFLLGLVIYVIDNYSDAVYPCVTVSAITIFIVGVMGLSLINKNAEFQALINDYENTKALVETYNGADYGNMNALSEKIIYINEKIAKHKALSQSKWSACWYSEEIGNLEPIVFKRNTAQ